MKLGIGSYKELFLNNLDFCLKHLDVLELQDFVMPSNLENTSIIQDYKRILADFAGEITLHGPYINLVPTSLDYRVRAVAELRYLQAVAIAGEIGASKMVVHSYYDQKSGYSGYDEAWLRDNLEFWSGFLKKIQCSGIAIMFENCHDQRPATFARLISELNTPYFTSCLDVGHCHCLSAIKPEAWIAAIKGRYFHITDNDGIDDSHLVAGQGSIDFENVSRALAACQEIYLISEAQADFELQLNVLNRLKGMIVSSASR